mgnify:CR=1 FL=1
MKKEIIAESGEKSLVIALGEGSEDAFTKIYHAYFRKIYSRIFFLVKDEEQTDELVQELFLKLWTRRAKLDASKSIQAYLFTVAQNLVYDHFRKIAANRRLCHELSLQMSEVYWHTDQLVEEKEQNTVLTRAIESLSPQRKKTFELCKLEGYSYQKASEVLGISHATINTHITHSFKILKNYVLKSYC